MSASYASIAGRPGKETPNHSEGKPQHKKPSDTKSPPAGQAGQPRNFQNTPKRNISPTRNTTFERDPAHAPQTGQEEQSTYILTLHTTQRIYDEANALRQKYFPHQLNKTPAHITLFHALPGSKSDQIKADLLQLTDTHTPFKIATGSTKRLKRGIAIQIKGTHPAKGIHDQLRKQWFDWLSEQDRGGFQGHYTVMNKVEDEEKITNAIKEIDGSFKTVEGEAEGLTLWQYDKGHWRFPEKFTFQQTVR